MSPSLTVAVPGTLDGLAEATRAAVAFCETAGIAGGARRNLLTALDEVLANVVNHGLVGTRGTIELTMARNEQAVVVVVADTAPAFNPLLAPEPDTSLPLEARRPGGLGIALVRALADDVTYERCDGRNHLTLTWRLSPRSSKGTHAD